MSYRMERYPFSRPILLTTDKMMDSESLNLFWASSAGPTNAAPLCYRFAALREFCDEFAGLDPQYRPVKGGFL